MTPKRRLPEVAAPIKNKILGALLRTEYRRLVGRMEHVELKRGATLYRANQRIEHVYFPEDAVVAMVDTMANGRTVEVGIIGIEGLVGINMFLGGLTTPDKAVVQIPGSALRMKSREFRKEVRFGSPLQRLLLRYTQAFVAVISQSVACCEHHSLEQRLARWMLMMHDYTHPHEFLMSHQAIAAMLGTRRAGVSTVAATFRKLGLISYRRGRIMVLDKRGLELKSCECYRFIMRQYESWRDQVPRLLALDGNPTHAVPARKKRT